MSASVNTVAHDLPRSAAGRHNPWLVAIIASIATFMEVLDTTIANVSLYHISAGMGVSYSEAVWVLTSYIVANALILPISGWLATVMGRKRYYMISVAVFTFSSFLCSIAPNLEFLIFARILQGIGGGGLAPVEQSMLVDSFPREKLPQAFALYGVTILVAPAIGPLLGGWLTEALSWHWVFLINIPVGLVSLVLSYYFIDEPPLLRQERKERLAKGLKIDYIGFALVLLGFGALQLFFDRFEINDGFDSTFICAMAIVAFVSLSFLVIWEWFHPHPVMDVRLFLHRNFAIGSFIMFLVGFLIISTTQLLPQMTQELLGYDAYTAGLTLGAGGLFILLSMMVTGAIAGKLKSPQWLIVIGLGGTAWAMSHLSSMTLTADFNAIVWARVFQMIWLPLILVPVGALAFEGLPKDKSNEASALSTLTRNIGGSIGIALMVNILHNRTHLHHGRLGEHVTSASDFSAFSFETIAQVVYTQARMMSYLDIYYVMGVLALLVLPIPLLLRRRASSATLSATG